MRLLWNWDDIRKSWLHEEPSIGRSPDDIVRAFNRVELVLGRDWFRFERLGGVVDTLRVVSMGVRLSALEGLAARDLIERLRRHNAAAEAELSAIYLTRLGDSKMVIELEPLVAVGERQRRPDFSVARDNAIVYVEVTRPRTSILQRRLQVLVGEIASLVHDIKAEFVLNVYLRREPSTSELESLKSRLPEFCALPGKQVEELADDLGQLILNESSLGKTLVNRPKGQPGRIRIGAVRIVTDSVYRRQIVVRLEYSDQRAQQFVNSEARQLPTHAPGLIMVDVSTSAVTRGAWEESFARLFSPTQRTRVSGICLFSTGIEKTVRGFDFGTRVRLMRNQFSRIQLPDWLADSLDGWPVME